MINPEEFRRHFRLEKIEQPISAVLTETQVRENFQTKIRNMAQRANAFVRLALSPKEEYLFAMISSSEYSPISPATGQRGPRIFGEIERGKAQEIAFEVMKEYGLDEEIHRPKYNTGSWNSEGVTFSPNGAAQEILLYPSQTVRGLMFQRERGFLTPSGETVSVSWSVCDMTSPFRVDVPRMLFQRKTKQSAGRP